MKNLKNIFRVILVNIFMLAIIFEYGFAALPTSSKVKSIKTLTEKTVIVKDKNGKIIESASNSDLVVARSIDSVDLIITNTEDLIDVHKTFIENLMNLRGGLSGLGGGFGITGSGPMGVRFGPCQNGGGTNEIEYTVIAYYDCNGNRCSVTVTVVFTDGTELSITESIVIGGGGLSLMIDENNLILKDKHSKNKSCLVASVGNIVCGSYLDFDFDQSIDIYADGLREIFDEFKTDLTEALVTTEFTGAYEMVYRNNKISITLNDYLASELSVETFVDADAVDTGINSALDKNLENSLQHDLNLDIDLELDVTK